MEKKILKTYKLACLCLLLVSTSFTYCPRTVNQTSTASPLSWKRHDNSEYTIVDTKATCPEAYTLCTDLNASLPSFMAVRDYFSLIPLFDFWCSVPIGFWMAGDYENDTSLTGYCTVLAIFGRNGTLRYRKQNNTRHVICGRPAFSTSNQSDSSKLHELILNSTMKRTATGKYARTMNSVEDNRLSSQTAGHIAIMVICIVFGTIVLIDVINYVGVPFKLLKQLVNI